MLFTTSLRGHADRRADRHAVTLGCELVGERSDQLLHYRSTNLSLSGMWIETADPVRAGEQVVVCFEPPGYPGGELMLFAEVARVQTSRRRVTVPGSGMGLEFMDLTQADGVELALWLADRPLAPSPRLRRWHVPAPPPLRAWVGTTVSAPASARGPTPFRPLAVWR